MMMAAIPRHGLVNRSPSPWRGFLIYTLILLAAAWVLPVQAQVWVGTGYDGVSQRYYLATVDTSLVSADSLAYLRETSSAVDEAEFSIRSRIGENISWDQTSAVTSLAWHHQTTLRAQSDRSRNTRLGAEYRLDWKSPLEPEDASLITDFSVQGVDVEAEQRGRSWSGRVRGSGEWVHYPNPGDFGFDYGQYRGELRLARPVDIVYQQALSLLFAHRKVPDSSAATYTQWGGALELPWRANDWWVTTWLHVADRRYESAANRVDFGSARLTVEWRDDRYPSRWSGRAELEGFNYYDPQPLIADYAHAYLAPRYALPLGGDVVGYVEPGAEWQWNRAEAGVADWSEPRCVVGADYFHRSGRWVMAEVELARRLLSGTGLLVPETNYWRFGVSVTADGPVWGRTTLSLLYSQEWEWHREDSDDISVSLVSMGLRYRL